MENGEQWGQHKTWSVVPHLGGKTRKHVAAGARAGHRAKRTGHRHGHFGATSSTSIRRRERTLYIKNSCSVGRRGACLTRAPGRHECWGRLTWVVVAHNEA